MEQKELKKCVHNARHGSAEAFGRLYEEYSADLYRFAFWYLHSEADAEDAVQDACLQAYKSIRNLRKEEAFRSWFFKILANICRDKLAAPQKQAETVVFDENIALYDLADETAGSFVGLTEIGSLIAGLGEPDSGIVLMSVLAGFNSKEIGAALHLNSSTVRSRLSRALAKLREQIIGMEA